MNIPASELHGLLRSLSNETEISVRDRSGQAVMLASRHEAEILLDNGHVEGVGSKRGFKYLRLTVATRPALAKLRRRLCCTARTVAEASQLTTVQEVAGRRVLYAHHTRRVQAYEPALRQGSHPVYSALRVADHFGGSLASRRAPQPASQVLPRTSSPRASERRGEA